MSDQAAVSTFITKLLHRLMSRYGGTQIFLFGPEGEPFWPARVPITQDELHLFAKALDFIERVEAELPKPFVAVDPEGRYTIALVGADFDLYVVVFVDEPDRLAAEARVYRIRDEMAPELSRLPPEALRVTGRA